MWKWYCLICTSDKAWESVDRCGFWLQKAFSSSGSVLPSSPQGSLLCYLHSLYLTPRLWVLCCGSHGKKGQDWENWLCHLTADSASHFTCECSNKQASVWPAVPLPPARTWLLLYLTLWCGLCKACPFFAWLGPLTSLHNLSTYLQQGSYTE